MKKEIVIALLFSCSALAAQEQTALMDSVIALVSDRQIPFETRFQLLRELTGETYCSESTEGSLRLLDEAREHPDKKYILALFRYLIYDQWFISGHKEKSTYADSILFYIDKVSDPGAIGRAYLSLGEHFSDIFDYPTSHSYYYKAIQYLEQSPENRFRIAGIYYAMSVAYLRVNDYDNLKQMENKLFEFASKYNDQEALVRAYCITSAYYGAQSQTRPSDKALLDSISFYERKAIETFEKIPHPASGLSRIIGFSYYNLSVMLLDKGDSGSLRNALEYIEKAMILYVKPAPNDFEMQLAYHDVRGNIFLKQGKLKQAEEEAQSQLDILSKDKERNYQVEYREMYDLFANIEEAKGNYREALNYERLRNEYDREIYDVEKYEAVENIKTQYDVREKEEAIVHLTKINRYQQRISYLYLFTGILFVAGLLLVVFLLLLKRKNTLARLQITQLKKDEAEIQVRLKEEMLKRSELEKYEALIDIHFKGQELSEQKDELRSLSMHKEKLEKQIVEQAEVLEKYETRLEKVQTRLNTQSISGFLDEIKQQIRAGLGGKEQTIVYLREIDKIDNALLIRLDQQSDGKLSPAYIRYCICFIIGMNIKDIADCFCVEISTVHIARYRLKQRFKLEKDEDLDLYFKALSK